MFALLRDMTYHRLLLTLLFIVFFLTAISASTLFFTKLIEQTFVQDVKFFTDTYRSRTKEVLSDVDEVSRRLSFSEYGFTNGTASDAQFFPDFLNGTVLGKSAAVTTFYIDLVTVDEWAVVNTSNANIYYSLKSYSSEDIGFPLQKNLPYTSVYTLRPPSSDNLYHVLYSSYGRSAHDLREQSLSPDTDCLQYSYSYDVFGVLMPLCGGIASTPLGSASAGLHVPIFKPIYKLETSESPPSSGTVRSALSSEIAGYLLVYVDLSYMFPNSNGLLGSVSYSESGMLDYQGVFWSSKGLSWLDRSVPSILVSPVMVRDSSGYSYRFRATYRYVINSPMFGIYVIATFVNFIISALVLFLLLLLWRMHSRLDDLVGVKTRVIQDDNRRLEELSFRDGLTGLYNRRFFDISIESELNFARRLTTNITLLIIDIDHFKDYNDNYGHIKGDEALRTVANVLSTSFLRSGDIVTRYGGEEFAVILPRVDRSGVHTIAQRLLARFEEENLLHEYSEAADHMTVSIGGVTATPGDDFSFLEMVILADGMLYLSKRSGRNKYTLFTPEDDNHRSFLASVRGDMDEDTEGSRGVSTAYSSIFGNTTPPFPPSSSSSSSSSKGGLSGDEDNPTKQ